MKTISMETERTLSFAYPQTMTGAARRQAGLAQWMPAPAPRALPAAKACPVKARAAESLWLPLPAEPIVEKLIMGLLVLAALGAIGYGFSLMLDLVQGWAGFDGVVGQLVQ